MTSQTSHQSHKLEAIQVLRAVAAGMVVMGHLIGAARNRPEQFGVVPAMQFAGGAGVDIFFLISGFIMVYASRRMFGSLGGAKDFVMRRLVRIVPLYWAVTLVTLMLMIMGHGHAVPIGVAAIAASFAFFPFDTLHAQNGFAFPLVNLGWTLNYEMMFYVVFAVCIPFGRLRAVATMIVAMAAIVAAGRLFDPSAVSLRFWTQPIILEFAFGAIIALATTQGLVRLPVWTRVVLVAAAIVLYFVDPFSMMHRPAIGALGEVISPNGFERVFGWGLPSALLLIATVSGPTALASVPARSLVILGDASYALYLLHPFVIAGMLRVSTFRIFPGGAGFFVILTFLVAATVSIAFHWWVERPVTTFLTGKLQRSGAPIKAVPLTPDTTLHRAPRA